MSEYLAPLKDMEFVLKHVIDVNHILSLDTFNEFDEELISAILEESSKFTSEVLSPLNQIGDEHGSSCSNGAVTTPPGWKDAYELFVESGWNGLAFAPEYGGQGLPWVVATAVQEMWHSANMSFGLCPILTQGAIRALVLHGTEEQKSIYLPKLVYGEWTGTMNLTEAHAGSDLAEIRTRAVPADDHYKIIGQKIFITYGDHDLTENIIHFVLARAADSPAGVRGISLFIVPKFLVNDDGTLGKKNDLRCVSLEHKLGIHASPTAVMSYGDQGGAVGYLVGEKNRGLEYMFTMMNLARHAVGVEGLSIAERAYQQALDYAKQRVQGRVAGSKERTTIIHHPDVKRMLMTMKSLTEAMRLLAYFASAVFDLANEHPDQDVRKQNSADLGILTPLVKGWCAEAGNEVAYIGIQVHGGMGFIEETGAAQYYRDARITPIYEGTTGIQANDLIGRKLLRNNGADVYDLINRIEESCNQITQNKATTEILKALGRAVTTVKRVTQWVCEAGSSNPQITAAASVGYLHILAVTVSGWLMAIAAARSSELLEQKNSDSEYFSSKLTTANYFATHIMPRINADADAIVNSSEYVLKMAENQF